MNAWRMLARGCGPVLVAASLSATFSTVPAVGGQEAPQRPKARAQGDEQTVAQMFEQKMRTQTSVEFVDTPLADVRDFLTEQAGIPFAFDENALTDAGVAIDTPVSLHLRDVRLESVLSLLLEPLDLDWEYRDEAVLITSKAETESLLGNRVYPVGDLLQRIGPHQPSTLVEVVCEVAPSEWDEVGGPATADILDGSLVVTASRSTHAAIGLLLADLRRAYSLDAPPTDVSATEVAALAALGKRLDVELVDTPLIDACEFLADQSGAQFLLHERSLTDAGVANDTPTNLKARGVTLRSALNRLLAPLDLTWVVRNEVLMILSKADSEGSLAMRLHPLGELADDSRAERVKELIESSLAPSSWDDVGGPGSINLLPGLLVVRQTDETQGQVAELLEKLRGGEPLPQEAADNGQAAGDGYRRAVYLFSGMSPDDVASAIKATIAPDSWQAGKGSIHIIRADPAAVPATGGAGGSSSGESGGAGSPAADAQGKQAEVQSQFGGGVVGAAPGFVVHRLVVIQRSDAHAQIQRLLHELGGFGSMGGGMGGGFFRLRPGK